MQVTLREFVPEWLPMQGKKVRVFHHGMKTQCNACYSLGHMRYECKGVKINWKGYVDSLRKSGKFTDEMFGSWIENDRKASPIKDGDLRGLLNNPENLKKALEDFLTKRGTRDQDNNQSQEEQRDQNPPRKNGGYKGKQAYRGRGRGQGLGQARDERQDQSQDRTQSQQKRGQGNSSQYGGKRGRR